jgi:hypothetical protein
MADYQDLADMTPILKNVYMKVRKKAFPFMSVLLAQAKRGGPDKVRYAGNDLFFSVKMGRRGGFVASRSGFLPEHVAAVEKQGRLGIARMYAVGELDGLNARATEDPKGAFISASKKLVEDIMDDWQIEQNRFLHGDGMAVRGVVQSRTSATVVTVEDPYNISGAGPGGLLLAVGDTVASLDANGSPANVLLGKAKISAITHSGDTATITFASSIEGSGTIAANDLLVTAVATATDTNDTSHGAEPYGLKAIVDVEGSFATFEGLNDSRWVAQKLTSTTVDETIVMKLLNTIRARAGVEWRGKPGSMLLLTTTGIWQQYGDSLLGLRRFDAPTMQLNGGFTGVQVAGATLVDDPWAPRGRIYAVHAPDTIFVDLMDFGQISFQDAPRWQRAATRDAWQAVYGVYMNYGVTNRVSQGVISSITDTVNYSPVF